MNSLSFNRTYPNLVMRDLSLISPVPADCPVFRIAYNPKLKPDWNDDYIPYKNDIKWCWYCIAFRKRFCDGNIFDKNKVIDLAKR